MNIAVQFERIEKSILIGLCWNVHDNRNVRKVEMLLFCKFEGYNHLDLSRNKQILNTRKTTFWYMELYPSWSTWWLEAIISILAISEQQQCKRKLIVYTAVIRYQLQITLELPSSIFLSLSQILNITPVTLIISGGDFLHIPNAIKKKIKIWGS